MRHINKVIIHCSATPEGRDISLDTIRQWHIKRGWSDIGYHYVILINGTIQEGRPVERAGAHCKGHNANSIGVCYVGGVDEDMKPKDTRTAAQKIAMQKLLRILTRVSLFTVTMNLAVRLVHHLMFKRNYNCK